MKIVSWNINSLRKRQDRLFDWLEAIKPDIVCLQETKCPDDQFPALALQAVGYRSAYHGEKSYNGVGLIAERVPPGFRSSLCGVGGDSLGRGVPPTLRGRRAVSNFSTD